MRAAAGARGTRGVRDPRAHRRHRGRSIPADGGARATAGTLARVKPFAWTWNAGVRAVRGIHPRLARPDDAWAERHLVGGERELYRSMDPRERDHGVRVARTLVRRTPDADPTLVRAALLHDVGKSVRRYAVYERILVHLLPGPVPPPDPPRRGVVGARQVAAHHPAYGAAMLRAAGAPERLVDLVARHHAPGADPGARALHDADRRT